MYQETPKINSRIAEQIIAWYTTHQRQLPWRETRNPYRIWLSEIILQQTRVQQGLPYYQAFIQEFATVEELANAPQEAVLRLWQGLGYYSRARNLHACAKKVTSDYGGSFPKTYQELQNLPGIGRYTAAAIASFAYNEVVPVVDGNVFRVLSRLYAETTDIASSGAFKTFFKLASQLIDTGQPAIFNQAIMEFGALQCTPNKPACMYCPVNTYCLAYKQGLQHELPVKAPKKAARKRYFHFLVCTDQVGNIKMENRPSGDIWQGLYQFPLLETSTEKVPDSLVQHIDSIEQESPIMKHQLSHQTLYARFYRFKAGHYPLAEETTTFAEAPPNYSHVKPVDYANIKSGWYSAEEVENLPKPVLISNYLKESGF